MPKQRDIVLVGDVNLRTGIHDHMHHKPPGPSGELWKQFESVYNLQDVWRTRNPTKESWTYVANASPTRDGWATRIDHMKRRHTVRMKL
eukprot:COSAG02_NODE_985_length_15457_cov_108.738247_9_plen_89_part_00